MTIDPNTAEQMYSLSTPPPAPTPDINYDDPGDLREDVAGEETDPPEDPGPDLAGVDGATVAL
ncbi:MAG TPA: hypothetical protein VK453_24545 [Micromonosporaceae bacterium]|nr:hypothetical protein [Micromonosporaceae bacterium]